MDLGYTFMVSLGQGESWKEILGEPVKMVVFHRDGGGPWWTLDIPLWFPRARVDLGRKFLVNL